MVQVAVIAAARIAVHVILVSPDGLEQIVFARIPPVDVFHSPFHRMHLGDGRRVVDLEGMFRSTRTSIRTDVCQLQAFDQFFPLRFGKYIQINIVIIVPSGLHARFIRKGEHSLFVFARNALVIHAPVDRVPRILSRMIGAEAVGNILMIGAVHHGLTASGKLVFASIHAEIDREQPQRVYFVARFQIPVKEIPFRLIGAFGYQIFLRIRFIVFAITFRIAARVVVVIEVIVDSHCKFAPLYHPITADAQSVVGDSSVDGCRIAFESSGNGHDVQHSSYALGIVLGSGRSNHLDVLDGVGRHTLQHLFGVGAHHIVRLPVHVYLEFAAAVHLNVIFTVYGHHRHFAQHLYHGVRLRVGVVFHIVGNLVYLHLHQRLLRHDLHPAEFFGGLRCIQSTQIDVLLLLGEHELLPRGCLADRGKSDEVSSGHGGHLLLKLPVRSRDSHFHHLVGRVFIHDPDGRVWLSLMRKRIHKHSFHRVRVNGRLLRKAIG